MPENTEPGLGRRIRRARNVVKRLEKLRALGPLPTVKSARYKAAMAFLLAQQLSRDE